jgi:hypothetical protein
MGIMGAALPVVLLTGFERRPCCFQIIHSGNVAEPRGSGLDGRD